MGGGGGCWRQRRRTTAADMAIPSSAATAPSSSPSMSPEPSTSKRGLEASEGAGWAGREHSRVAATNASLISKMSTLRRCPPPPPPGSPQRCRRTPAALEATCRPPCLCHGGHHAGRSRITGPGWRRMAAMTHACCARVRRTEVSHEVTRGTHGAWSPCALVELREPRHAAPPYRKRQGPDTQGMRSSVSLGPRAQASLAKRRAHACPKLIAMVSHRPAASF